MSVKPKWSNRYNHSKGAHSWDLQDSGRIRGHLYQRGEPSIIHGPLPQYNGEKGTFYLDTNLGCVEIKAQNAERAKRIALDTIQNWMIETFTCWNY